MISVVRVERDRFAEASALLAVNLADDPGVSMVIGGRHACLQFAARWFEALLGAFGSQGGLVLGAEHAGRLVGVLVLFGGGQGVPAAQPGAMAKLLRVSGIGGFGRILRHAWARRKTICGKPIAVEFIAIAPEARGQGISRLLFDAAQQAIAPAQLWLDTSQPANVAIFSALGFAVVAPFTDGAVAFTAMQRG